MVIKRKKEKFKGDQEGYKKQKKGLHGIKDKL